jgi:hypothetical protein
MKFGGWIRLWIVLSAIYAICITSFFSFHWFTNSTDAVINHEESWLSIATTTYQPESIDKKSLRTGDRLNGYVFIGGDPRNKENWIPEDNFFRDLYLKGRNEVSYWSRIHIDSPKEDIDKFSRSIFSANDRALEKKSIAFHKEFGPTLCWVLIWLIPTVVVFLLGLSIRWIVLGFKKNRQ